MPFKQKLLNILAFMLPFSMVVNDQLSTCIMLLSLVYFLAIFISRPPVPGSFNILVLLPALLIVIRGAELFYHPGIEWQYIIRAAPFFIFPVIFYGFAYYSKERNLEPVFFKGLLYGTLLIFAICEGNVLYQMIANQEPLEYLFRWRHLNIQFTSIVDLHPPYLGIICNLVLIWLFLRKPDHYKIFTVLLLIFMLQLLARNAIVFAGLLLLANTIIQRKYKVFSLYVLIVLAGIVIALLHPSDYLRQKMSTAVDIGGSNSRFIRLQASWETFLENPVFGAGKQVSERKRVYYYAKRNDEKAIKNELNAHNQYMEYLSTYGIFGFLLFLVVVGRFLYLAAYKFPSNLDTWLIVAFLFASITESTLERSLGIKIFSFIMALTVYHILTDTQFRIKSNLNGHRNLPSNGV